MQYIKATLRNGVSGHDSSFIYKMGQNIHPSPDRKSKEACGIGIHLAKTIKVARHFVPQATEFYLVEAGVILGEDEEKVRCASCNILKRLTAEEITAFDGVARKQVKFEASVKALLTKGALCGEDWLEAHWQDVSQADIDAQKLAVIQDSKVKLRIGLGMNAKDRKFLLRGALAEING